MAVTAQASCSLYPFEVSGACDVAARDQAHQRVLVEQASRARTLTSIALRDEGGGGGELEVRASLVQQMVRWRRRGGDYMIENMMSHGGRGIWSRLSQYVAGEASSSILARLRGRRLCSDLQAESQRLARRAKKKNASCPVSVRSGRIYGLSGQVTRFPVRVR